MAKLIIHNDKISDQHSFMQLCPFGALELNGGKISVTAACKMCKLCVKNGPKGAAEYLEETRPSIDKSQWRGVAVYVDHSGGEIHPVTYELLGKARELADKIGHPVFALCMGSGVTERCKDLLHYGVDTVFVYDNPQLNRFRIEPYASVFQDFVETRKPSSILVGGTTVGRQLAPRVAARLRTGLTADCTVLDMRDNTDLVQIRPAFGGNIMAEIVTPSHRPQMATVRYKVMDAPSRNARARGAIISCSIAEERLTCGVKVKDVVRKEPEKYIESADVLIVAGRGVKKQEDLHMLHELADLLGGQVACTRPMIESGWIDGKRQIGLSGRTVRPKLIITCGVSGSIQFVAGMNNSEMIVAINKDEKASIMKIAHIAMVGDLYEIIPGLISRIKGQRQEASA